jgi:SNF2 family DNA or RNA helicase
MLHISHLTRSIAAPFSDKLGALFPHGQRIEFEGEQLIVIPHGLDETRLLRNLGHAELPSPIEEHYDFPSADGLRPFKKQLLTSAAMTMNRRFFVLNSMGTGKTKACIWAFHFLQSVGKARRMLIVCPLSTVRFTWEREIFNTLPDLTVRVLTGTAARRRKLLAEDADIFIINHDGVGVIYNELKQRRDIDVVCFDEVATYRNARAQRSKLARELALTRSFVWGMTGSPTPTAPTDAFGLARLITPETAPRSFTQFRGETMLEVNQFKWVPKRGAADTVSKVLSPAVRYTLDEIVELPPVIEREIQIEMGARQHATYKMLKDHASALLKEGSITAINGGVLYSKLLQTSIGWVYGDDNKVYELDNHNRINALLDIIEGNVDSMRPDGKTIVFSPFISAMEGIATALSKAKIDFATVSGSTPTAKRGEIFQAFQHTDKLKVINAHPDCMSHGLTLTAADTIIWFGPTTKLETYEQANARIRRVGQTRKQQIIKLVASDAERLSYRRLEARQDLQDNVLGLIAELTQHESAT